MYYDLVQHPDVAKWQYALTSSGRNSAEWCIDIFSKGNMEDDFYYVIKSEWKLTKERSICVGYKN